MTSYLLNVPMAISPQTQNYNLAFLDGGGEMGELTRKYDWASTSIGPPQEWPQTLRTAVGIILNSRFPMFLFWGPDLICFYNNSYRASLGNDGKHPWALGKKAVDVWPEIWDFIKPVIDDVLTGKESWYEDQLLPIYRNGHMEDVYWTFSYGSVKDEDGNNAGVFVTCTETTDKVMSNKKLMESEDQLRFAVNSANLGTWDFNPATNKFTGNDRLKDWFGLSHETELNLDHAVAVMAERDRARVIAAIQWALDYNSAGKYDVEYTIVHPISKRETIVRAIGRAWFDDDKKAYRFNGTLEDVTERVTSRRMLEDSELFARNVIDTSEVGQIVWYGKDMVVTLVNEKMVEILGRDSAIIGMPYMLAVPEFEGTDIMERLLKVFNTGVTYHSAEQKLTTMRDGQRHTGFYSFTYKALRNSAGGIYGIIGTGIDVTDWVTARKSIEASKERTRLAIEAGGLGVFEVDLKTNVIMGDRRFDEIMGVKGPADRSEYVASIDAEGQQIREKTLRDGIATGIMEYEARAVHTDGEVVWFRSKGVYLYDAARVPVTLFGVVQDITKEKGFAAALEKEVSERTAELERKNEELERFTYAASHDMQEPLRKVSTFLNMLEEKSSHELNEKSKGFIGKIGSSVNRMKTIIEDLLLYSHQTRKGQAIEAVDTSTIIASIEEDLELIMAAKNAVITKDRLPVLHAVKSQMHQLFLNLMTNSLKFSQPGVPVRINISSEILSAKALAARPGLDPAVRYYQISVSDNGIGFSAEYSAFVFELFKRLHSKSEYEGTGIGLSLCKKIVETHGGQIYAESEKGNGATFFIILPMNEKKFAD